MTALSGPTRQEARGGTATEQLARLMRARPGLNASFKDARRTLERRLSADEIHAWTVANLELIGVNCGPSCLLAFWRLSLQASGDAGGGLSAVANRAAYICRHAGAQAAAGAIDAYSRVRERLPDTRDRETWWRVMAGLAETAPESVNLVSARIDAICGSGGIGAFEAFIATGLRSSGSRADRRAAFFSLEDPLARQFLEGLEAGFGFTALENELKGFLTALWGHAPHLRRLPGPATPGAARRTNIAGPVMRLPEIYRGVLGEDSRRLFRAAAAHASAHLELGGERFAVGKLKPLQVVLIGLIEDARVETLAIRRYPGLQRLWAPYHVAAAYGVPTAPSLLARLARALFDLDYTDDDTLIEKARALFHDARERLHDPAISREIGGRLGNDFGQRRIQFDAKGHVVEPVYRDDGLGLWDFEGEDPHLAEEIELAVDAIRIERREAADAPPAQDERERRAELGKAKSASADGRGSFVSCYPEWDAAHRVERPDWTTVRAVPIPPGDPTPLLAALDTAADVRSRIAALVRTARLGRAQRLKRQPEGHDLDLDAVLDAVISARSGEVPDGRIFRSSALRQRDLAVLVLIDTSESTRERLLDDGSTILDVEKLAVALLAEAMQSMGDRFAMLGFSSDGREQVRISPVKSFDEPYDRYALARLSALKSGLSTRLGAALRHAGAEIERIRSFRKLILVLSDGEPSDVDVPDPDYLAADARRAVLGLKARGIDTFGVTLDPAGVGSPAAIFGRGSNTSVRRIKDLPSRLAELYFRLARR